MIKAQGLKVKRIQVKPGASLSLQKHQQAEHWIVVKVEVTCGQKLTLTENQSTYIPLGKYIGYQILEIFPLKLLKFNQAIIWVKMILLGLMMSTKR